MKQIIMLFSLLISFSAFAYKTEVLVNQKDVIWGFDFFNDGKMIFTERGGKIYTWDPKSKKTTLLTGTPEVYAVGQGGMLDVRVHPKNEFIYITYSEPKGDEKSATVLSRFKLKGNAVTEFKKLFTADTNENPYHYGSRIEFMDGKIFITSGERGDRPAVQRNDNFLGKMVRMNEDGSKPEIWSKGLRSPQGLMKRPGTNELWEAEMGPQGGDELNIIKKDANYGWAVITYGKEYEGPKIGEGKSKKGMEQPVVHWVPSISPSAMTFYTGDKMPEWKGNIFLALLSGQHLRRLELNGTKVTKQEELFKDLDWRFRNVRTGTDGFLWFSTDEGKIGRVITK